MERGAGARIEPHEGRSEQLSALLGEPPEGFASRADSLDPGRVRAPADRALVLLSDPSGDYDPCVQLRDADISIGRVACSLPEVTAQTSARADRIGVLTVEEANFLVELLVQWAVVGDRTPPRVVLRPEGARSYSFAYVRGAEPKIRYDPEIFRRQLAQCERCRDRMLQVAAGNLAHELGHWLLDREQTRSALRQFCEEHGHEIVRASDGAPSKDQWIELHADYVAGLIIGRSDAVANREIPLADFFEEQWRWPGDGIHPYPSLRRNAIRAGGSSGVTDRCRSARSAVLEGASEVPSETTDTPQEGQDDEP